MAYALLEHAKITGTTAQTTGNERACTREARRLAIFEIKVKKHRIY